MIIVFQNNEIIGIDRKLLSFLNITLENLSPFIKEIELEIKSLLNEEITIYNQSFNVKKADILSPLNIKIFDLSPKEQLDLNIAETNIDLSNELQPLNIEIPQPLNINLQTEENETNLNLLDKEINNIENLDQILEEPSQKKPEIQTQNFSINEEKIEAKPIKNEISLSFEDEFSEIEKMLTQSKEEASKNLEKELEIAAKELDIDIDTIYDLKNELFEMLKQEKSNFFKALKTKNYIELHKIAHKLKGAALNLRLSNLAYILKQIDEFSKAKKDLHKIEYLINKFYEYLDKLSVKKPKNKIPKEIKQLILNTIEDYLTTQNEKKFKKDLKYIEKILNKKINSLEELEEIIKE